MQDATRLLDGKKILIKKVKRNSKEAEFGRLFSSVAHSSNPANHCVPVYESFDVPDDDQTSLLVMPFLRNCRLVDFETVGEVVEFVRQMFEVSQSNGFSGLNGALTQDPIDRACNLCITCISHTSTSRRLQHLSLQIAEVIIVIAKEYCSMG